VTANNDTPQIPGEDGRHDAVFDTEWRAGAGDPGPNGAGLPAGPAGVPETDEPEGAAEAEPRLPWAGWIEPARQEADGAAGQLPWLYPPDREYPWAPEYAGGPGYSQAPEYPRGPGYAPVPADHPGPAAPGYPAGPGYLPDAGYRQDLGYPQDGWNGPGSSPAPGWGYAPDGGGLPQMEPLPGWAPHDATSRPGRAPTAMPSAAAGRVPPQRMAPAPMPPSAAEYELPAADGLTAEALLHGRRQGAGAGWRRGLSRVTGGLLRLGESSAEMRRRDLINRVRTPVAGGHHRVAVLSLKGGVGKTTTAVGLGATFATLRGDRVIAVDANPDRGTLSDKVRLETAATIRDLLNERDQVRRYADMRAFTSQAPSRLEVLASDRDPAVSVAFGADDYCDVAGVLEHFYSICLTDCGTGLLHSAMSGVLRLADQVVLVSSPSVDGARSASATLDWLEAHHCDDLVRNGVVVLSAIRPKSKSTVDLDRLERHFAARCRAVIRIPYDAHLEEGAEVELELLSAGTADAYLTLAAIVGDGLAWPRRPAYRSALPECLRASRKTPGREPLQSLPVGHGGGTQRRLVAHRRARLVADGDGLENH
jgi:MinD-like ATPase involved in chromosome partitioning or flagellar assembly